MNSDSKHEKFKIGDQVKIKGIKLNGRIEKIYESKFKISINNITIKTSKDNIQKVDKRDKSQSQTSHKKKINIYTYKNSQIQTPSLDLHGCTLEESILMVDKLIDNAIITNQKLLKIIHGKGKGILKNMIKKHFGQDNRIKSVITNHQLKGGVGVTFLEL